MPVPSHTNFVLGRDDPGDLLQGSPSDTKRKPQSHHSQRENDRGHSLRSQLPFPHSRQDDDYNDYHHIFSPRDTFTRDRLHHTKDSRDVDSVSSDDESFSPTAISSRHVAQRKSNHANDRPRVVASDNPVGDAPDDDDIDSRTERSPYAATLQGTEPPPYRTMESLALPMGQPSIQISIHGRRQDHRDNGRSHGAGSQNGLDFADFVDILQSGDRPHDDRTLALRAHSSRDGGGSHSRCSHSGQSQRPGSQSGRNFADFMSALQSDTQPHRSPGRNSTSRTQISRSQRPGGQTNRRFNDFINALQPPLHPTNNDRTLALRSPSTQHHRHNQRSPIHNHNDSDSDQTITQNMPSLSLHHPTPHPSTPSSTHRTHRRSRTSHTTPSSRHERRTHRSRTHNNSDEIPPIPNFTNALSLHHPTPLNPNPSTTSSTSARHIRRRRPRTSASQQTQHYHHGSSSESDSDSDTHKSKSKPSPQPQPNPNETLDLIKVVETYRPNNRHSKKGKSSKKKILERGVILVSAVVTAKAFKGRGREMGHRVRSTERWFDR